MWFDLLLILLGLGLLFYGGEFLISGSIQVAKFFKLSPFTIGAIVMGFGTSAPELCVSLLATLNGAPEVSLGNVVGSNIANIGLVLGITALIAPVTIEPGRLKKETPPLLIATGLLLLFTWNQLLSRTEGFILFGCIIGYVIIALSTKSNGEMEMEEEETSFLPNAGLMIQVGLILVGLAGLVLGAHWMVQGAVNIARSFGISEWLIGITIVAVGTSLPEIVSSTLSALKGHGEMALGNVFGSNIFNITMVLGAAAIIQPLEIVSSIQIDLIYCGGLTITLIALIRFGHNLLKRDGIFLLTAYAAYIGIKSAGLA